MEQTCIFRPATNEDGKAVLQLVSRVLEEYGLKSCSCSTDSDLLDINKNYFENEGHFQVCVDTASQNVIGSAGICKLEKSHQQNGNTLKKTCELRKMYLSKESRGKGIGKKLLDSMILKAKELGYQSMELETSSKLKEAKALYEKYGFKQVVANKSSLASRCDEVYAMDL